MKNLLKCSYIYICSLYRNLHQVINLDLQKKNLEIGLLLKINLLSQA